MNHMVSTLTVSIALAICAAGCSTTASTSTSASGTPVTGSGPLSSDAIQSIDSGYRSTIDRLYVTTPGSRELVSKARGVLVFPRVIAAGLVVGGQYGQGELRSNGAVDGYYKTTSGSIGLQVGAESKALVFLFMTQESLDRFRDSHGWAGGVDASVALLKVGANGDIDANSARAPTLAFVMTNSGLMADLSLEGTKITKIQ
jgi:lipid-binding SYLF domain-containing protein